MSWKPFLAAMIAGLVLAGPALALVEADVQQYEVRLPQAQIAPTYTFPSENEALGLLPALGVFQAGDGAGWRVLQWNPALGTASSIGGPAIPLVSPNASEEAIRAAVEAFVARNAALLKADPRELLINDLIDLGSERTYVIMSQYVDGLEVINGRLDVALWRGQIVLLGSDLYQNVDLVAFPTVDASMAAQAAHLGIPSAAGDAVQGEPRLVVLPVHTDQGISYHLAWEIHLKTQAPENVWWTYVDAHDATVLSRESEYQYFTITGSSHGQIEENWGEPYFEGPMEDERITASGSYTGYTNEVGDYTITVPNNVSYSVVATLMNGRWSSTNNMDGADASITHTGAPGTPVDFLFDDTNSHPAERDAYYHVNFIHDWVKGIDPAFTGMDFSIGTNVNINSTCNAFYNGSVNFYKEGGGCNNTGRVADVVYHEYGHGISVKYYVPQQVPGSMSEGFADIDAMCIHPDPCMGDDFYVGGGCVRSGENLRQYPGTECSGQVHCLGEIIMGAMWKTRVNMAYKYGATTSSIYDALYINTLKTKQTSQPNFLNRMLLLNDTDGNLANGTTDWYEICDAFVQHNLPCPPLTNYVTVSTVPLDDQTNDVGGYPVLAIATAVGGGAIDPSNVKIFYTTDPIGGNPVWSSVGMTATGNPNEYSGTIPQQDCGKLLKYYVRAAKFTGEFETAPHLAPYRTYYQFGTGAYDVALTDDFEADLGWTIGDAGDDATAGFWQRVNPGGKTSAIYGVTQPEDDHTAAGTQCFVTDGTGSGNWAAYDVDGGVTSVLSPIFDWSATNGLASFAFWLFFFDVAPPDDSFRVAASNDGGTTWTEVLAVNSPYGDDLNSWNYHKVYFSSDDIPFTNQMRIKFSMEDITPTATTCAEALVDDILIRVNDCTAGDVSDGPIPAQFRVEQNQPNPFGPKTAIRFGLPAQERVQVEVFDAAGRHLRTLLDSRQQAGFHTVVWDGRDGQDHPVGSGVYYYTVKAGANQASRKMMVLK